MGRSTFPDGTPYHGAAWCYAGTRNAVYLRDGLRCIHCGRDARGVLRRGGFTLDHVRPCSTHGIDHSPANLITSCRRCNVSRQARTVRAFSGADGVRRARNAVRRALPAKREGLALHKAVKARGPGERVAEARRRGWLGRK